MIRLLSAFVVAALSFALCAKAVPAQEKAKENRLSLTEMKTMFENMGYEPKELSPTSFEVKIESNNQTNHVVMTLSPDGSNVWFNAYLVEVKNPEQVPAKAWLNLLEESQRVGPSHFVYYGDIKRIYLVRPMANIDITPVRMRATLNQFVQTIRDTRPIWDSPEYQTVDQRATVTR